MVSVNQPQTRRWTRDEYHKAAEVGIFRPDERLELLNGEVLAKMSPQSNPHASGIVLSAETLREVFQGSYHIREEKPVVLSDASEPEPDLVVVRGTAREVQRHPTPENIVLLIEVSDSTLRFDQGEKATAYARSGIADYWILNLRERRLEVRRDPGPVSENETGYRTLQIVTEGGEIAPLALPEATVRVGDMLPSLVLPEDEGTE